MKKLVLAAAFMALSAPAFAASPTGTYVDNPSAILNQGGSQVGNAIGQDSAQIIQNGQFVSGNCGCGIDQTTGPGTRSEAVQTILNAEGKGNQK